MSKLCPKCGVDKDENEYSPSQFLKNRGWCRFCLKEYTSQNKEKIAKYKTDNKSSIDTKNSEYRLNNKTKIKDRNRVYYVNNKEKIVERNQRYDALKRDSDPAFKLRKRVSNSIFKQIKISNSSKDGSSILQFLPYTIQQLKEHLEKQFEPWMTWENYGTYEIDKWNDDDPSTWTWQMDHIIPHSTFKYASMDEQAFKECWALSNLRPLSAKQNVSDGNRRSVHRD
jgi:hypothetical protein